MSISWEGLQTYEDWAYTLKDLLENARKAIEKDDAAARGAAKRELITFIDESPNWLIRNLDDVAHEAIKDLGKADISEAITSIENRTVELIRLTKSMKSIAEDAEEAAGAVRAPADQLPPLSPPLRQQALRPRSPRRKAAAELLRPVSQ